MSAPGTLAVVVPTMTSRRDVYGDFVDAWAPLFERYGVQWIVVYDGDAPQIEHVGRGILVDASAVMGDDSDLLYTHNDGVRNAGFYYIARRLPEVEVILTLDDDVLPLDDPIQAHLDALAQRVPVSWMSTASEYTRGFPYGVRQEAEVVLSHGVWEGVADWDAATQLVCGNRPVTFYRGPIPRGVYYPMCGMNLAFKRKLLPYMYFAPMGPRAALDRFADIWCGIESKRAIDACGWAVVTGYARVRHERASNVFANLQKEARGLVLNETYWDGDESDPYFAEYCRQRNRWRERITALMGGV